jgi:small subunit ribosomal protein S9
MAEETVSTPESTETETEASEALVTETVSTPNPLPPGQHWYWGTGRRKAAVARVRIRPGSGNFLINGRRVPEYFTEVQDRNDMHAPLEITKTAGKLDVYVKVEGGGPSGQAGAVRLGLARALKAYDDSTEEALRDAGFLTVDARKVERKKYGQPGARRRFQFSKR